MEKKTRHGILNQVRAQIDLALHILNYMPNNKNIEAKDKKKYNL